MVHIAITRSAPHIACLLRTIAFLIMCALFVILASPAQADTITVTNSLDSGPGSLRQAVFDAAPGDVVVFDSAVITVELSAQIEISKSLTIDGTVTRPEIKGGYQGRAMYVMSDTTLTLINLRIRNFGITYSASLNGGAILNYGVLFITDCDLTSNEAYAGGAISNTGVLTIVNSNISFNTSTSEGGAIHNAGSLTVDNSRIYCSNCGQPYPTFYKVGGAIYNTGTVRVISSTVVHNVASYGAGLYNNGIAYIFSSQVISNYAFHWYAGGGGGGIYNVRQMTLKASTISANGTGSMHVSGSNGGIVNHGYLTATETIISNNTSGPGGGIGNYGTLYLENVAIYRNWVDGGMDDKGYGGGLMNGGTATVINTTIAENSATAYDAYETPGYGGGIANNGMLLLINSTIYSNTADTTADQIYNMVWDDPAYSSGVITAVNTIVGGGVIGRLNCVGPIVDGGHNIERRTSCKFTSGTSRQDTDPRLAPLEMNPTFGSDVPTMALLKGSPAIDMGNDAACPATDARGLRRPQGSRCDIGAYEVYNMRVYLPRIRR